MSDFTSITSAGNTGTDLAAVWGAVLAFGGVAGANEYRFADTGAGGNAATASASWAATTRSLAVAPVRECYLYPTDGAGYKVNTYTGAKTNSLVFRLNFDALGSMASAPRLTAFANILHPAPTRGLQIDNPIDGANIINGAVPDTGASAGVARSFLYANIFGSGLTALGAQETPVDASIDATTLVVTSGVDGAVTPAAAAYAPTWQSLQGWVSWLAAPAIPKPLTSFFWYFTLALFMGPNMKPGIFPFVLALDYTYS